MTIQAQPRQRDGASNRPPLSRTFLEICQNHEHNRDNRREEGPSLLSGYYCCYIDTGGTGYWSHVSSAGGNISKYANMSGADNAT